MANVIICGSHPQLQFLMEDVELEYSKNGVSLLCNEWSNVGCCVLRCYFFFIYRDWCVIIDGLHF